ncbi:MAG: DUF3368 domain-containing protein [Verrucomicrobiales bacterium]
MGSQQDRRLIRAVLDTGPLLHFHEAGLDYLLGHLVAGFCPQIVADELENLAPGVSDAHIVAGWLKVKQLTEAACQQSRDWQRFGLLDRGEADALALAQESKVGCLLTDDAAARLIASSLGLVVRGSLGLVLEAGRLGMLSHQESRDALRALRGSSLWLSERVYAEALRLLGEMQLP